MIKRPRYCEGIGLFRGTRDFTVWVKIRFPRGGQYKGRSIRPGASVEHKLGKRSSWDWPELVSERDRLQSLADKGESIEPQQAETFAEYAGRWLERRKPTLKGYGVAKGHIDKALGPAFGAVALDAITPRDINDWISTQRRKLSASTVKRQLSTFNAVMNDAVRAGVIDQNPSLRADKLRGADEPRQRFVTEQEIETILATAERIEAEQEDKKEFHPQQIRGWLRHFVVWALHSGMRRSEILGLRFGNVREIEEGHTEIEVLKTKTDKGRTITCTPEMERILKELRSLERIEGDDRLFPVSLTTAKRSLTRLWAETGLEDVRLHDLRRTHASMLIRENVDPRTVAGRLGHRGTAMLSKHYAVDRGDKDAAQRFGVAKSVGSRGGPADGPDPMIKRKQGGK
ncbi:MAG: tyrosine-type recombinase/integrase [Pseudomonadota bacterium]